MVVCQLTNAHQAWGDGAVIAASKDGAKEGLIGCDKFVGWCGGTDGEFHVR